MDVGREVGGGAWGEVVVVEVGGGDVDREAMMESPDR